MTVAELITKLKQMPQEAPVVIEDSDTMWLLNLQGVYKSEALGVTRNVEHVAIYGDYDDLYIASEKTSA